MLSRRKAGGSPPPSNPAEWAGLIPLLDWDPENATADGGGLVATLPDSSGNGNDAELVDGISYPFSPLPPPALITSTAFGTARPTLEFRGNPNVAPYAPALRLPTLAAGPITIGLVMFSDMPDHAAMTGGGGGTPIFTNNYALSCEADALGIYADGGASRAFGGWLDSSYGEPLRAFDFASTPTVVLLSSSGESSAGAADAVTRLYAKTLTPNVLSGRTPFAGGPALLGSYQGGMTYSLQGEVARLIIWPVELTPGVQSTAAINALGSKYSITIAP